MSPSSRRTLVLAGDAARAPGTRRRLRRSGLPVFTSIISGGLGALTTFAHSPWYQAYASLGMTQAGLTPEQDQQLAGLVMWVPGGLYHLAAALWFLAWGDRERGEDAVAAR